MSFVAVAIGGSALIGAGASIISSSNASKAQQRSSSEATALERERMAADDRRLAQDRADLAPYREGGYKALGQIGTGTADGGEFNRNFTMADYQADPGYQFRLDQGNRGVEASAAARGGVLSGGAMKALSRYNQGLASQEYGAAYDRFNNNTTTRFNRLASIAGIGQTATNTGISAGQFNSQSNAQGTAQIANNLMASGNARASQYVATGNAVGNAAGQLGQYFALRDLYKTPTAAPPPGAYGIAGSDGIY